MTIFDGNYQKLKELFDGQYKQFEIGKKQLETFTNNSEAQLNEAKTAVCVLKEISDQFEQNIEKVNFLQNIFNYLLITFSSLPKISVIA